MKRAGLTLLVLVVLVALGAPWLAPNSPTATFADALYSPPTPIRISDRSGLRAPFIYPQTLEDRLARRFAEDRERPVPLEWFSRGRLMSIGEDAETTLLLLGGDAFGRDIFSRLLHGARTTLLLAAAATLGALFVGALAGGIAGYAGGTTDELVSRFSDFVLVLPAIYVALALRAVMPLVLPGRTVFLLLAGIFILLGWPVVARGVRAIIVSERERDYAQAAVALGASPSRILLRHLMPATAGYLGVQATLLLPAFIVAEATLSYVGLGFPDTVPTWGTMLQDAANISLLADSPWMLAPAAAIFIVVLAVNLTVQGTGRLPVQLGE